MSKKATAKEIEDFKNLLVELNVFVGDKFVNDDSAMGNVKAARRTGGAIGLAGGSFVQYLRFAGQSGPKIMQKLASVRGGAPVGIALAVASVGATALAGGELAESVVTQNNRKTELENLIEYSKKLEKKLEGDERENVQDLIVIIQISRSELLKKL